MSSYCEPGNGLCILFGLSRLFFIMVLWGRYYYFHVHFIEWRTEAFRWNNLPEFTELENNSSRHGTTHSCCVCRAGRPCTVKPGATHWLLVQQRRTEMRTSCPQSTKSQPASLAEHPVTAAMEMPFLCTCSGDFQLRGGGEGLPATLSNSSLIPSSANLPQDRGHTKER